MGILDKPYGILTNPAYTEGVQDATADAAPVPTIAPQQQPATQLATVRPAPQPQPVFQPNPLRQQRERSLQSGILSMENRPKPTGFWGKAGHILSNIGNAAGNVILGANNMAMIPGTQLHDVAEHNAAESELQGLEKQDQADQQEFGRSQLQGAQTREADARADSLENPPEKPDKFSFQQTDHGLMRIDNTSGEATPVTYQGQPLQPHEKEAAAKGMEHVPLLGPDGHPMIANYHPDTGKYTDTAGNEIANPRPVPPPPSYGQLVLPTKTSTFIDPSTGVPTEFQWNSQTNRYDIPVGQSATGGYGHEAAQAGAVERAGNELVRDIEANRAGLGTLGAWVAKYGLNTPIADPKLAGLQSKMASFAALNPAMHGARGLHAMEHFEKLIGGLQQNPDASIAGIKGIIQTAHNINPGDGGAGSNAAPSGQHPNRPANVPEGYVFKENGPKGKGWYKP